MKVLCSLSTIARLAFFCVFIAFSIGVYVGWHYF